MRGELPTDETAGLVTDPEVLARVESSLHASVERVVAEAGAERVVVALDGGLGSTATATLAADALGADRVTGLVMPAYLDHAAAAQEAELVAEVLGVSHARLHLHPLLAAFQRVVEPAPGPGDDLVATGAALSRLRTACAYYVANATNGVVVGGANRTDLYTGRVVKHGDTGVDCLPLGGLYRTEVRALGDVLDLPAPTRAAVTEPDRMAAAPAREEAALDETNRDRALHALVDRDLGPAATAERLELPREAVERVAAWCVETAHRRRGPTRAEQPS